MAASPPYKIYDPRGLYQAATQAPVEALVLAKFLGDGSVVRWQHGQVLWREGSSDEAMCDGYDAAIALIFSRHT